MLAVNLSCPGPYVELPAQELPTSPQTVVGVCVRLFEGFIVNPKDNPNGAADIWIKDGRGFSVLPGVTLVPGGMLSVNTQKGRAMLDGIVWWATAAGVHGHLLWGAV